MSGGMVIVGAGECGVRAALALREEGYDGPVTLIGAERHAPYERPPMSKGLMLAANDLAPRTIATPERLAEAGIAFHASVTVRSIDRERRLVLVRDDRPIGYERLLLATGHSRAASPAPPAPTSPTCAPTRMHSGFAPRCIAGSESSLSAAGSSASN